MASSTAHPAPPGFVVEQVHPPQLMVLHSNSLVAAACSRWPTPARAAPACCGSWARTGPWWLSVAYLAALVPADDVLADIMLAGVTAPAAARPKGHCLDLLRRLLTTASWAG